MSALESMRVDAIMTKSVISLPPHATRRMLVDAFISRNLSAVPDRHAVLHTVPLELADWFVVAGCSLAPILVVELVKLARRTRVTRS